MNTGNETVDYLGKINFVGNVIPNNWFKNIKFESGKVDINSILILSELIYWHRPTVLKDEITGDFIGYQKKFKADKLQKSYESLANQFGLTKRQVKESTDRLQNMNLIEKEFRNIKTPEGQPINNVLYFSINHLEVERITFESNSDLRSNVTYPTIESKTNTVITTENTTDIKNTSPKFSTFDLEASKKLYELILINNPNHKKPNLEKWANDVRLMRIKDKRTEEQIMYVIDWSQNNNFWKSNILSTAKLREKFDTLVIKIKSEKENKGNIKINNKKQDAMSMMLEQLNLGGYENEPVNESRCDQLLISEDGSTL